MEKFFTDIAVIGAGASGLTAAIAAERYGTKKVTLIEKMPRVGKKILSTGNGRCNLSNTTISENDYNGDTELLSYTAKEADNITEFFSSIGLLCRKDDSGRIYPYSMSATSVLDALRFSVQAGGAKVICDAKVNDILKTDSGFKIICDNSEIIAKKIIMAAGGCAAPSLGSNGDGFTLCKKLGHNIAKLYPALAPIRTQKELVKAVKGLRTPAVVSLISQGRTICSEAGEVQFTDGALSGICIFNISAKACEYIGSGEISLDTAPDITDSELFTLIKSTSKIRSDLACDELLTGLYHKRIGQAILKNAGISLSKLCKDIKDKEISAIVSKAKDWRFPIKAVSDWSLAQVTCGGIPAHEVTDSLESRKAHGMYLCGEILNIQGKCGGYNLDWAWKSGYTAGKNAAVSLMEKK